MEESGERIFLYSKGGWNWRSTKSDLFEGEINERKNDSFYVSIARSTYMCGIIWLKMCEQSLLVEQETPTLLAKITTSAQEQKRF